MTNSDTPKKVKNSFEEKITVSNRSIKGPPPSVNKLDAAQK